MSGPSGPPALTGRTGAGREGARRPFVGILRFPRVAESGAAGQSMARSHAIRVGGRRPAGTPAPQRCGQGSPPGTCGPRGPAASEGSGLRGAGVRR